MKGGFREFFSTNASRPQPHHGVQHKASEVIYKPKLSFPEIQQLPR